MHKNLFIIAVLFFSVISLAQTLDGHFIQSDDYFISDTDLEGHSWIGIEVAKMIQAPGPDTNGEAKFLVVRDGKEKWTKHYWQTRIAQSDEIKLGLPVIMFDYTSGGNYIPPKDRKIARTHKWFMAKITDTSTAYKGNVLVSGGYTVNTNNIRLLIDGSEKPVEAVKTPPKRYDQKIETPVRHEQVSDGRFLKIIKATYGGFLPENSVDVTAYLQSRISGGKLNAKADDGFLRVNMNSGFEKTLKIKYETNEGVFETAVLHGMETNLPDKNHRKVK
ncbi:MAG: hypothetical protein JXN63_05635 [Candidatus Delongbacteria bacterium]|nr:hypothetical protein [Candidatus Delongbacteria bacterium]